MTSYKKPTPEEVTKAVAVLVHPEHQRQFFDRLENPNWVTPLAEKGLFNAPPPVIRDEAKGTIAFPSWSQARYLARMAAVVPEAVLDVILHVPETENTRILDSFVDAALVMPLSVAAKMVPQARQWARKPHLLLLPRKLGDLVERLALGKETKAALSLARDLLSIVPDPRPPIPIDRERDVYFSSEPRAQFGLWEYGEILRKSVPALVQSTGISALHMLCDLLQDALRLSRKAPRDSSAEDLSQIWRPAIEEHGQNADRDVKGLLVSAIRDATELIASGDESLVPKLIKTLRRRRSRVFLRLSHHLLRTHPDAYPVLLENVVLNRGLFQKMESWHEYCLLLGVAFKRLSAGNRERLLGWVEEGPKRKRYGDIHQRVFGQVPTDEQFDRYRMGWQRNHLALISDDLPDAWKDFYKQLIVKVGPPDHPEFGTYHTGGVWGHQSPKTATDLSAFGIEELVGFLRSWEPKPEMGPVGESIEGLARQLSSVVTNNSQKFAAAALEFRDIDPTYVRAIFEGLREPAKKREVFPWAPVLAFADWVMGQNREVPGRKTNPLWERDPDWGWTRSAIARLVSAGIESEPSLIPIELRESVWNVLHLLSEDPEPTPEYESQYEGKELDALTLSINTTRGEAMHGIVRYALWIYRNVSRQANSPLPNRDFEAMPEVRDVLDRHLNPDHDPSAIIRSVYGYWTPSLVLLDTNWFRANADRIFPMNGLAAKFGETAWYAYILASIPYDNVFAVLRKYYRDAVEKLDSVPASHLGNTSERLGNHLMAFLWRGKLGWEDPDGLLPMFFSKASDTLRGRTLVFVGTSLRDSKDPIPGDVLERIRALWTRRLDTARAAEDPRSQSEEMAAFGWWYASAKFGDVWGTHQLLEALKISRRVEVSHLVVERLLTVTESLPDIVADCLTLMVEGDKEGTEILGWSDQAIQILASLLKSADTNARKKAKSLVNLLGRLGRLGPSDLKQLNFLY